MKKVVFAALVALTVGLVACGGGNGSAPATDSTAVDSTLVISDSSVVAPVANYRDSISVVK